MSKPLRFVFVARINRGTVKVPKAKHYHCQMPGVISAVRLREELVKRCNVKRVPYSCRSCYYIPNALHREFHLDAIPNNVRILAKDSQFLSFELFF